MQTSYENNLSSNMLSSEKEYIPYEVCDHGFHRAESPFCNSGIATPDIDSPVLPSKNPWCRSPSHKPDSVLAEQFISTAGKALFPSLEHNLEMFVREHQVHEANEAPDSYFSSESSTAPISNRQLDFNIDFDISSNWYSSNECSSVGISDKTAWRFQYDKDLLETHLYNVTLSNSLYEENLFHAQNGTSYPVIFDFATDYNHFRYKNITKSTQVRALVNNHTENTSERSHYMDASEAQACYHEHMAFTSDNDYRDMKTSSESVTTPSKSTLDYIPEIVPFSHRIHGEDSNAYIRRFAEPRTKNAKDHFGPNMDIKDDDFDPDFYIKYDLEYSPGMELITTPESVQAYNDDDIVSQSSTSPAYEISQSPPIPRINQEVQAQTDHTDGESDPSTPNGSLSSSTSRLSLKWRHVLFDGMNEIKQMCEARDKPPDKSPDETPYETPDKTIDKTIDKTPDDTTDKRSHQSTETLPLNNDYLDKFWTRLKKDHCYICLYDNCMRRFSRSYNVRVHIKTHLDYRQYRCKFCPKSYIRRHDLNRHMRSHIDDLIDSFPGVSFHFV